MGEALVDAILGCIVGGAIGDAAGAAFEGLPDGPEPLMLSSADWHLTDDTQLTLATCEALVEHGTPDPAHIAASFLRWFRARRLTGLGASTWPPRPSPATGRDNEQFARNLWAIP